MTANTDILPTIDPLAFVVALVLAPLAVALALCWLLIPVVAVPLGAAPYLIFGAPLLLWMVTNKPLTVGTFAIGGLLAQMAFLGCVALAGLTRMIPQVEMQNILQIYGLFGAPHAMAWCGCFAAIYRRLWRPVLPPVPAGPDLA